MGAFKREFRNGIVKENEVERIRIPIEKNIEY